MREGVSEVRQVVNEHVSYEEEDTCVLVSVSAVRQAVGKVLAVKSSEKGFSQERGNV